MSESKGVVAVTGGTRGIGAEIALESARQGYDVFVGFRDPRKVKRVNDLSEKIGELGCDLGYACVDLVEPYGTEKFVAAAQDFADLSGLPLRGLVLNAAGGLEQGVDRSYATTINSRAPHHLALLFTKAHNLADNAFVTYVTSNPSHFWGRPGNFMPTSGYETVAQTKFEGELALRSLLLSGHLPRLMVATADLVDETAGATIFKRTDKELMPERDTLFNRLTGRGLPTAEEFGRKIAIEQLGNFITGHTLYVPRPILGNHALPDEYLVGMTPSHVVWNEPLV